MNSESTDSLPGLRGSDCNKLARRESLIPSVVAARADLLQLGEYYNADMARYASWKAFVDVARAHNEEAASAILAALNTTEALWGRPGSAKIDYMKKCISNGMWKVSTFSLRICFVFYADSHEAL